MDQYGVPSISTTWEFPETGSYTYANMQELASKCGESRLWGGMHFSASIPGSYELCDGVGELGYTSLMKPLLGVGTYAELQSEDKEKPFFGEDTSKSTKSKSSSESKSSK